jgi:hypothetical protein
MAIPLNPLALQATNSINNLAEARLWIERFSRPVGFNTYAWETTKRLALQVWRCYFDGRSFERTLNFMHPTFYDMIRTPEGNSLLSERLVRKHIL